MAKPARWFLLTWCAYVLFALLTRWDDFGARASPDDYVTWTVTRISTVTCWLLLAFLLLRDGQYRSNRDSFIYATASTAIVDAAAHLGTGVFRIH